MTSKRAKFTAIGGSGLEPVLVPYLQIIIIFFVLQYCTVIGRLAHQLVRIDAWIV